MVDHPETAVPPVYCDGGGDGVSSTLPAHVNGRQESRGEVPPAAADLRTQPKVSISSSSCASSVILEVDHDVHTINLVYILVCYSIVLTVDHILANHQTYTQYLF